MPNQIQILDNRVYWFNGGLSFLCSHRVIYFNYTTVLWSVLRLSCLADKNKFISLQEKRSVKMKISKMI